MERYLYNQQLIAFNVANFDTNHIEGIFYFIWLVSIKD